VLYALHRYTDYDYPFGIFKLFLRGSKFHKNINKRIILESNRKCTYKWFTYPHVLFALFIAIWAGTRSEYGRVSLKHAYISHKHLLSLIRVITKLPNSEQSYKGKVKTHNYINRQNQSTTGKLWKRNDPDLVQAFLKKWWVESDFKAPNLPISLRFKGSDWL
jgi:hypothetical protein